MVFTDDYFRFPPGVVRSVPEVDAAIKQLEDLALSREARGTYDDALTDAIIALAKSVKNCLQRV